MAGSTYPLFPAIQLGEKMPTLADAEIEFLRGAVAGSKASDTLSDLRMKYYAGTGTVADREIAWYRAQLVGPSFSLSDFRRNYYVFTRPALPKWYSNADMQWNLLVFS